MDRIIYVPFIIMFVGIGYLVGLNQLDVTNAKLKAGICHVQENTIYCK